MADKELLAPLLFFALSGIAAGGVAVGQDARYELGLRVRAFERAFEPVCNDVAARERVCPSLQQAVTAFFGVRLEEVARQMDGARRLLDPAAANPASEWADSLSLRLRSRFVDLETTELSAELRAAYDVESARPKDAALRLRILDASGTTLVEPTSFAIAEVPLRFVLPLRITEPGDHRLLAEILDGGAVLAQHEQTVSFAKSLAPRMKALQPLAKERPRSTLAATARGLSRLLAALAKNGTKETDVPAARHLDELERVAAALRDPENATSPFALSNPGDFRIWLKTPKTTVASRVLVPKNPAPSPIPIVVALHGAGGSENLFFDGYGDGKIVRLCEERGWLLVAPRSGLGGSASVDAIVTALAAIYPIDKERVFAVGHSMGAAQLMADACANPAVFRAVAALGGSGSVRPTDRLRELPVFVAPGEKDFALGGARRLRDALKEAGVATVDYREYEAAEHLGIVQVALDSVLTFFDRFAKPK